MVAYRLVYDSRHLQADYQEQLRNPIRSVIEYGLPLHFSESTAPSTDRGLTAVCACDFLWKPTQPRSLTTASARTVIPTQTTPAPESTRIDLWLKYGIV